MKNSLIIITLTLILTGCASLNSRGQYIDDKQIASIRILKTTKTDIIENLGTPNVISDYTKNTWYYVSRTMKDSNVSRPRTISQRVLVIEFNDNKIVLDYKLLDIKDIPDIKISKDKTAIEGTDQGALIQYIKNIGRFSSKPAKKKK